MSEAYLAANAEYAAHYPTGLDRVPTTGTAVVTCMDARIDPVGALGLRPGDAHVIRNAGGVVTIDVIRSLVLSQHLLRTHRVVLISHANCGLEGLDEGAFKDELEQRTGERPMFSFGSFTSPAGQVREGARLLRESALLKTTELIGFVFHVENGRLEVVELSEA